MAEKFVNKELVVLAQIYDGNPQKLIGDTNAGALWFELFNTGQARYNASTSQIILNMIINNGYPLPTEINIGDCITYYQGMNPPRGSISEIIRIENSKNFKECYESQEDRNNRITKPGTVVD